MDENVRINDSVVIPAGEMSFVASKSGGPGGQHVNTTSSRVTLKWNVDESTALTDAAKKRVKTKLASRISAEGVLSIHVDTERSQHQNREIAVERLVDLVAEALKVPKKRVPTKMKKSVKERILQDKKRRSDVKKNRSKPSRDDY